MRFQTPEKKSEKTISGKHAPLFCRFGRIFYLCGFDPNFMTRINTPKEVLALAGSSAADKLQNTAGKTLILAFLAGAYIAIGGLFSLMAGFGFPGAAEAPGFQRLLSGAVFPLGLILVVFTGAELFTGNNAVLMPGALARRYGCGKVARNWTLVWMGNLAGALFFTYFLVVLPGVLSSEMWREAACNIAQAKVSLPWSTVFLRGVGANWLVCLAVWLGMSANDVPGRMLGLFFPIMCFVVIGYEHCIANMFFIPLGMLLGAPVSAAELFAGNLVPATLGNIVGGGLFVGGLYWYLNRK